MSSRGVSLVEVLVGILLVVVTTLTALNFFAYGRGGVARSGNRRAAMERARERLEVVRAATFAQVAPAVNAGLAANAQPTFWLTCAGTPCVWTRSAAPVTETVPVDDLPAQPMETTARWVDDVDDPSGTDQPDALELGVRVWYTPNAAADDDFNRVHLRTLRAP